MGKDLKGKELGVGLNQRKDGVYTYRFTDAKGKRHEKRFKTKAEAKRYKIDKEYWDEHNVEKQTGEITLKAWFEFWVNHYKANVKQRTAEGYKNLFKCYIDPALGDVFFCDITPVMCQNVLDDMYEKGYAESTIKQARMLISALFRAAIADRKIGFNPVTENVCVKKRKRKELIALTEAQTNEFLEAAQYSIYKNIVIVGFETGLRVGELGALTKENIDFKNNIIKVRCQLPDRIEKGVSFAEPKTDASVRDVPMSALARKAIEEELCHTGKIQSKNPDYQDLIFKTKSGLPVRHGELRKGMISITNRINKSRIREAELSGTKFEEFPQIHPHVMRYTFATFCVEHKIEPKALQKMLGHTDIRTTMNIYAKVKSDSEFVLDEFYSVKQAPQADTKMRGNVIDFQSRIRKLV